MLTKGWAQTKMKFSLLRIKEVFNEEKNKKVNGFLRVKVSWPTVADLKKTVFFIKNSLGFRELNTQASLRIGPKQHTEFLKTSLGHVKPRI